MDYDKENFYYPFSWKKPLIYIVFFISICFYIIIFLFHHENESFGIINTSKSVKIFAAFFIITFIFHFFRASPFIQKTESVLIRSILLIGAFILFLIFMIPAWTVRKYDHEKMNTYMRVFPFSNALCFKIKETLVFNDIKSLKYVSGIDTEGSLRFLLNNGRTYSIVTGNISYKSRDIFLINLYQGCDWLQGDIEKQYGPIEIIKKRIEENGKNINFDIFHCIFSVFGISIILVEIICLIAFTFKI
jgi:hypothetical protein